MSWAGGQRMAIVSLNQNRIMILEIIMNNQDHLKQLIDKFDQLSLADQETFLCILNQKIIEKRKVHILHEIQDVRNDFKQGNVRPDSAEEIIKEIFT